MNMTYQRPRRLRRVQLATPASSEKMSAKAAASAADHVFLDLEDAVAPSAKVGARVTAVNSLRNLDWGKKTRCVRINDLGTKYAYEDIITVVEGAREHLDTIMVPKVTSASDVLFVATLLNQIEMNIGVLKPIGIEVLIEEVQGLQNIDEICKAHPRLSAPFSAWETIRRARLWRCVLAATTSIRATSGTIRGSGSLSLRARLGSIPSTGHTAITRTRISTGKRPSSG